MSRPSRHRVAVVALPEVIAPDLVIVMEAFGPKPDPRRPLPNRCHKPYEVELCGVRSAKPFGGWISSLAVSGPECIAKADTVVVPGREDPLAPVDAAVLTELRRAADRGARMVSVSTGAFALAAAGILSGHRVTTHWAYTRILQEHYPDVDVTDQYLYVDDGQVLTSGGVMASMDLCLHILRADLGMEHANDIARMLVFPPHRDGGQSQYIPHPVPSQAGELTETLAWMRTNLTEPLSVEDIARHAHLSIRTLSRKFRATTGSTVTAWMNEQRVERAKQLLEGSDLPITRVAAAVGFGTHESLRQHFTRQVGTTPSAYRATFRSGSIPA